MNIPDAGRLNNSLYYINEYFCPEIFLLFSIRNAIGRNAFLPKSYKKDEFLIV